MNQTSTTFCTQCGNPMSSIRSTKKYCSDICKQASFYERNSQGISSDYDSGLPLNDKELHLRSNTSVQEYISSPVLTLTLNNPLSVTNQLQNKQKNTFSHQDKGAEFPLKAKELAFNGKKDLPELPSSLTDNRKEEQYTDVCSDLLDEISNVMDYKATNMMLYPNKYWYGGAVESVKWVSCRLQSIIEEILFWGQKKEVKVSAVNFVYDCFVELSESKQYSCVPKDYPFRETIKSLYNIVYNCADDKKNKVIKVRIPLQQKANLIAISYQITGLIPEKIPLKKLDFTK